MSVPSSLLHEDDLSLAAQSDVPVLITAGIAADREASARLIHDNGARGLGPFVTFHGVSRVSGSTPSADSSGPRAEDVRLRRQFEEARGGTLFIDDITELAPAAQRQLFSLLEQPGTHVDESGQAVLSGVRVIAGASRALDDALAASTFFEPLFYRVNIIHIDSLTQHEPARSPSMENPRSDISPRA